MINTSNRHPLLLLISIITILSLAFSITTPAYAQKDKPGKEESQGRGQEKALLKLFERLQAWQERQEQQFLQAENISSLLEDFIDQAKAEGFDTTTLVEDLKAFKDKIKEARKSFQLAQLSLATHYGIDDAGSVYSVKSTRQMIKVASRSFGESHRLLTNAVKDISQSVQDWRLANGEAPAAMDEPKLATP